MEQKQKHNDTKELISDEGMNICRNCGIVVDHCQLMCGYIDFHENRYRIRIKPIYHRKYHIENVINKSSEVHQLSYKNREKTHKIFDLIGFHSKDLNFNRKRMNSIEYISR